MSKIFINATNAAIPIPDLGLSVPANDQLIIDSAIYKDLAGSNDALTLLAIDALTYSDGTNVLTLTNAIDHIKDFFPQVAGIIGATGIQGLIGDTGSQGIQGIQGNIGVQGPIGLDGPVGPVGPAGSGVGALAEYNYAESDNLSTQNSLNYSDKLSLTATGLTGGDYLVNWSYEYSQSSANVEGVYNVYIGNVLVAENDAEHQNGKFYPSSGFKQLTLAAGNHTCRIEYKSSQNNKAVSIRRARLVTYKVN